MPRLKDLAYWVSVGLVAIVACLLFKFIGAIIPVPAVKTLAAAL